MKRNGSSHLFACLVPTYSIVAYDPSNGDLGVTVQSRYFSVGSIVPWVEADVGAVPTQSFVNVSYGPRGLKLLKEGLGVEEVIRELTGEDEGRELRQLGIVDAKGNAAAYTGEKCLKWAGSKTGDCYSAQGNILVSERVVQSMAQTFESVEGDLASRLVSALDAGEKAGGDARGRQSAALLVVRKDAGRGGYGDKLVDLRVEDDPDPVRELKRLMELHRAYYLIDEGESRFAENEPEVAISFIEKALEITPNSDDAYIDLGLMHLKLGQVDEAVRAFKKALVINPKLAVVIKQLPELGIAEMSPSLLERIGV